MDAAVLLILRQLSVGSPLVASTSSGRTVLYAQGTVGTASLCAVYGRPPGVLGSDTREGCSISLSVGDAGRCGTIVDTVTRILDHGSSHPPGLSLVWCLASGSTGREGKVEFHLRHTMGPFYSINIVPMISTCLFSSPERLKVDKTVRVNQIAIVFLIESSIHSLDHYRYPVDTCLIHIESYKSPTAELLDVDSRRISIVTMNTKEYHSDILA
ncbi:hypothetical protein Tco_0704109 [Tanacetum coccineum]|uniref:Uncharacterized protein n=1 Tax=Tanacetum coccineum TaxID=301880 RepID=A0ABQ4Y2Q8_9ASTR